jgi:polyisoprenoid-binding protein YceI
MSKRAFNILGILILMGITAVVSVGAYILVIGGSGEASGPTTAPTLSLATETPNVAETQVALLSTQVADLVATNAALVAAGSAVTPEATGAMAEATPDAAAEATEAASADSASTRALYRIVAEESEVRFTLTEDLRGVFTTVVGVTQDVAGDIIIDFGSPANSQIGEIRINARTIVTDNEFRNRAIRGEILQSSSDAYEFISFIPTAVSGTPASVAVGESITFQVTGDLKIREIVQSVTFDVTATLVAQDRLEGTGTTVVTRTQYNLTIPSVPGVANVSDEVTLEIDFVATQVQQ